MKFYSSEKIINHWNKILLASTICIVMVPESYRSHSTKINWKISFAIMHILNEAWCWKINPIQHRDTLAK